MKSTKYELSFDGGLLRRGFWLYVWEIVGPDLSKLYYVGRTGDSSSENPQSPFNRLSQHLGSNSNNATLRKRLIALGIHPEECSFRLVAHGPLLNEPKVPEPYSARKSIIAALEKDLADAFREAGYNVINSIACRQPTQVQRFDAVRAVFATDFPGL